MKNNNYNTTLSILFMSLSALSFSQWTALPVEGSVLLNDFCQKDQNNIVAIGINGQLMTSADSGVSFQRIDIETITKKNLTAVACANQNCFVLAEDKVLVSSDNINWNSYPLPSYGSEISFFENRIGFITGGKRGELLKSINGGITWELIKTNVPALSIKAVSFISDLEGFAIGHSVDMAERKPIGKLLKTIDGGITWQELHSYKNKVYDDIQFVNASTGVAVGYNGLLMRTTDGGLTWNEYNTGTNDNLKSIHFASSSVAYIVGTGGKVLKTTNSGASWQNLNTGIVDVFVKANFSDLNNGLILAGKQLLKTTTGGL